MCSAGHLHHFLGVCSLGGCCIGSYIQIAKDTHYVEYRDLDDALHIKRGQSCEEPNAKLCLSSRFRLSSFPSLRSPGFGDKPRF